MKKYEVKTIKEIFDRIREINSNNDFWFRGQNNVSYGLSPSSYRHVYLIADQFGRPFKPTEVHSFNTHGGHVFIPSDIYYSLYIKKLQQNKINEKKRDRLANLTIAQHYGLPTPLLDWSTDATVGLYFALDGRSTKDDCALFLLNPKLMNEYFVTKQTVFSQAAVSRYLDANQEKFGPIAFTAEKLSKRICRQSGNFTLQGQNIWPIDFYHETDSFLIKITIPSNVANQLDSYLKAIGISKDSIYVEADEREKVCNEVRKESKKILRQELKKFKQDWLNVPEKERNKIIPPSYLY